MFKAEFTEIEALLNSIGGKGDAKMEQPKIQSPKLVGIDAVLTDPVEEWLKQQNVEVRRIIDAERAATLRELKRSQEERVRLEKERDHAQRLAIYYKKACIKALADLEGLIRQMKEDEKKFLT